MSLVTLFSIFLYLTHAPCYGKRAITTDGLKSSVTEKLVLKTGLQNSAPCWQEAWGLLFPLIFHCTLVLLYLSLYYCTGRQQEAETQNTQCFGGVRLD